MLLLAGVLLSTHALRPAPRRRVAPRPQSVATADAQDEIMATIGAAWETAPNTRDFDVTLEHRAPPVLKIQNFLSDAECAQIIEAARGDDVEVCEEYLNHRVNEDGAVATSGYSEEQAQEALEWSDGATSGLRVRMPSDILDLVAPKALSLLGLSHRNYRFKEELYYRPDRATVSVRDATVVRYREGEGVAPHVDGKDATLLVYLNTCRGGGHTVFPEDGLAFPPRQGGALLYDSRLDLLHYAAPVHACLLYTSPSPRD